MKATPNALVEPFRTRCGSLASTLEDGNNGAFTLRFSNTVLHVVVSDGCGWDHISVSTPTRCPGWEEMEYVRGLFARSDEWWMQLGTPRAEHINCHPCCLHWWRPQTTQEQNALARNPGDIPASHGGTAQSWQPIPIPPPWMVGVKDEAELRAMAEKAAAHIRRESRGVM